MRTATTRTTGSTRLALAATASVLVLGLGACASTPASTPASSASPAETGDHTDADVMFSVMMVPHHLQAVEMADLVPSRTTDAALVALAQRITTAQGSEVGQMTTWLGGWGADPSLGRDELDDHGGHEGADGMVGPDDLRELGALTGPAFDRRWLALMIRHHEGAVDMAKEALRSGRHAPTRELAARIVAEQQAELSEMRAMLAG